MYNTKLIAIWKVILLSGLNHIASEFYEITKAPDPDNISLDRWSILTIYYWTSKQNMTMCHWTAEQDPDSMSLDSWAGPWQYFTGKLIRNLTICHWTGELEPDNMSLDRWAGTWQYVIGQVSWNLTIHRYICHWTGKLGPDKMLINRWTGSWQYVTAGEQEMIVSHRTDEQDPDNVSLERWAAGSWQFVIGQVSWSRTICH